MAASTAAKTLRMVFRPRKQTEPSTVRKPYVRALDYRGRRNRLSAPTTNAIAALLPALSLSPALYPQQVNLEKRQVLLIRMTEMDYRNASFLDDRILTTRSVGAWVELNDIEKTLTAKLDGKPLHFIFHAGHVGSTLLSRLLDETNLVLSLREPAPLRTFAELYDHDHANVDLETFLKLWSRGFAANRAVVLKATSSTERLGQHLLNARPNSRAVCLNLAAEPYLATLLAGENAAADLNGHGPERMNRLEKNVGERPEVGSLGELAAMSWLTEILTQAHLAEVFDTRVLPLDFEELLAKPGETLKRVTAHFGLEPPPSYFESIGKSQVLRRYSKATEYEYSPQMRAAVLNEARSRHASEIRKGLDWLAALADRHVNVARVFA